MSTARTAASAWPSDATHSLARKSSRKKPPKQGSGKAKKPKEADKNESKLEADPLKPE